MRYTPTCPWDSLQAGMLESERKILSRVGSTRLSLYDFVKITGHCFLVAALVLLFSLLYRRLLDEALDYYRQGKINSVEIKRLLTTRGEIGNGNRESVVMDEEK